MLLRNGRLPRVWIPPAELRDQREMLRLRMSLVRMKTQLKNRIHGVLLRYNLCIQASDLYGDRGRAELLSRQGELPAWSRESVLDQLQMVDSVESQIVDCEKQLEAILYPNAERDLLKTLPCVGNVRRFGEAKFLVSYAGLVPSARESAERKRQGRCPRDCNV
jgi:transposase